MDRRGSKSDVEVLARQAFSQVLAENGLCPARRSARWTSREHGLSLWLVIDSKANDPYRGGAFTLEFERSDDQRFMHKLAGRARLGQLLTGRERARFVALHNVLVVHFPTPPREHLALIPPSLRETYLATFAPVQDLPAKDFWMRHVTHQDLEAWLELVAAHLPSVISRAKGLDPHTLCLGKLLTSEGRPGDIEDR